MALESQRVFVSSMNMEPLQSVRLSVSVISIFQRLFWSPSLGVRLLVARACPFKIRRLSLMWWLTWKP